MAGLAVPSTFLLSSNSEKPLDADTGQAQPEQQTPQPAFITLQALSTFAGVAAAVTILWKLIAAIGGSWAKEKWVPLVITALFGIYLVLAAWENAQKPSEKFGAFLVGAVNTAQVWASVVGIDILADQAGVSQTSV